MVFFLLVLVAMLLAAVNDMLQRNLQLFIRSQFTTSTFLPSSRTGDRKTKLVFNEMEPLML